VLDEAASRQSDPTVLTLQLRNLSKEATGNKTDMVGRIDHQDEGKAKKVQVRTSGRGRGTWGDEVQVRTSGRGRGTWGDEDCERVHTS
jgi:hypothetical protein